jgi:hypothetical protein
MSLEVGTITAHPLISLSLFVVFLHQCVQVLRQEIFQNKTVHCLKIGLVWFLTRINVVKKPRGQGSASSFHPPTHFMSSSSVVVSVK